jgi:hypothetical protein
LQGNCQEQPAHNNCGVLHRLVPTDVGYMSQTAQLAPPPGWQAAITYVSFD